MRRIPYIHIVLFGLTFLTTLAAGALQLGIDIISQPGRLIEGLPFAGTLMAILLSHELGHYFVSRHHRTVATLPYFIPAPSLFGTFGAFIKMKSPIITRRALVDIGASGPIVGFCFSLVAVAVGLSLSRVIAIPEAGASMVLGESLIFKAIAWVVLGPIPEGMDIVLHPVAFAGWIGLFVTSLNLLPIGQLDGGHVMYAVIGERHRKVSKALVGLLAVVGLLSWPGWVIWAVLMLVLGLRHPPVVYWEPGLQRSRRAVALAALVIFILTFVPTPMEILN
jgi:membrane-associated protease RseP (regulator of RpoE activity)